MLNLIILFLTIVNLLLICKTFKIFTEITNNQEELLYVLYDELNDLKDDGK